MRIEWRLERHTMVAKWRPWSGFQIHDRSGVVARDLAELEARTTAQGIGNAVPIPNDPTVVIHRAESMIEQGVEKILMLEMAMVLEYRPGTGSGMADNIAPDKPAAAKPGAKKEVADQPATPEDGVPEDGRTGTPEKEFPGIGT